MLNVAFFGTLTKAFNTAITDLKDIDDALTQLSKVTPLVRDQFREASIEALNAASAWGKSGSDYLSAVEAFAKAGKENYEQLANVSILAQAAGDISADLANEYLITSDAAFQLGGNVEKLTSLLDSQNQVTNRNAVTMEEIAEATKVYANTANIAGESTQTMTALIATGIGATQKPGQEVGRALRTLTMNIRSIKGETEDGIFNEETFGQAEKALAGVNIQTRKIIDGVVELKTASDVIGELAEKFQAGEISAEKLSIILENVATKRQADLLAAMVQNWTLYSKAMSDFEDASGSAAGEAQKDLESWNGKLNVLRNSWTAFVAEIIDTEWIKGFLDAGNGIVKIITAINTAPVVGDIVKLTTVVLTLGAAVKTVTASQIGKGILGFFKDIGRPKIQGFTFRKLPHVS